MACCMPGMDSGSMRALSSYIFNKMATTRSTEEWWTALPFLACYARVLKSKIRTLACVTKCGCSRMLSILSESKAGGSSPLSNGSYSMPGDRFGEVVVEGTRMRGGKTTSYQNNDFHLHPLTPPPYITPISYPITHTPLEPFPPNQASTTKIHTMQETETLTPTNAQQCNQTHVESIQSSMISCILRLTAHGEHGHS